MSTDEALDQVKARGLRVQMLFERPEDGLWHASLNVGGRIAAGYGLAKTPAEAIAQALAPRKAVLRPPAVVEVADLL